MLCGLGLCAQLFQSTLPTRGSDRRGGSYRAPLKDFNPRSPRGGATLYGAGITRANIISIHAPHEGERRFTGNSSQIFLYFNPRSPRGGATAIDAQAAQESKISIHAPHEGERQGLPQGSLFAWSISIHAPHEGERLFLHRRAERRGEFQSTLPTRGSDFTIPLVVKGYIAISIHAPHEGERRKAC